MIPPGVAIALTVLPSTLWATGCETRSGVRCSRSRSPVDPVGAGRGADWAGSAPPHGGGAHHPVRDRRNGWLTVVDDVRFRVRVGETVGLVGESGSGKTVTSLGVMGLLPADRSARRDAGLRRGRATAAPALDDAAMRRVRGATRSR